VYHGSSREQFATQLHEYDVVLTTYDTLRSDWENEGALLSVKWLRVVLDEGESDEIGFMALRIEATLCQANHQ
jgi:SNF2 family DNA or RNA helicase